jgi:vacuolar-type H+-ATPase subunit F/Vma7
MRRLVVIVRPDQVNGYRLAGLEALGVDDYESINRILRSWINNQEEILLALGDSLFSMIQPDLVEKIHSSSTMLLVTIPDGPVSLAERQRQQRIFDTIRHATGVPIRFKGEKNGTKV